MLGAVYLRLEENQDSRLFYIWWPLRLTETACVGLEGEGVYLHQGHLQRKIPSLVEIMQALQAEPSGLRLALVNQIFVTRHEGEGWVCLGDGTPYLALIEHFSMAQHHEPLAHTPSERLNIWLANTIRICHFTHVSSGVRSSSIDPKVVWA